MRRGCDDRDRPPRPAEQRLDGGTDRGQGVRSEELLDGVNCRLADGLGDVCVGHLAARRRRGRTPSRSWWTWCSRRRYATTRALQGSAGHAGRHPARPHAAARSCPSAPTTARGSSAPSRRRGSFSRSRPHPLSAGIDYSALDGSSSPPSSPPTARSTTRCSPRGRPPRPLRRVLESASPDTAPERFPTDEDALAYWINAYNAFVLHAVIEEYPIRSVWKARTASSSSGRATRRAGAR